MKHSECDRLEDRIGWVYICDNCGADVVVTKEVGLCGLCQLCGKRFSELEIDPLVLKESPELLEWFRSITGALEEWEKDHGVACPYEKVQEALAAKGLLEVTDGRGCDSY